MGKKKDTIIFAGAEKKWKAKSQVMSYITEVIKPF